VIRSRSVFAACAVLAVLGMANANAAPAVGRYDARLCVATSVEAAPSCGPAQVDWRSGQRVQVQISDVVYRLKLHSSQLDVVLTQGSMQLDEFSADYAWQGDTLQFADRDKGARYELQLGARKR
jgi:opacity protein-like surface antigen